MQSVRFSKDLPDNFGTLFVTDVRNASFQIFGRRYNGELYVTTCCALEPGSRIVDEIDDEILGAVEIVAGAEAEQLVQAMRAVLLGCELGRARPARLGPLTFWQPWKLWQRLSH
jgi:hypothetical protein